MMGPITAFFTALVGSAILSRPKADPKDQLIAELKTRLRICEGARDAARADRDQSDGQLRALTSPYQPHAVRVETENKELLRLREAHTSLIRMFAEEQAARLQLQRDLIEAQARVEVLRSNAKRSQAPQHLPPSPPLYPLPVPAPLTSAEAQRLGAEALERLMQFRVGPLMSELEPGVLLPQTLESAMSRMDAFICNCAPGRHELLNINKGDVEGDDTL
jgi:hypothetical protein